MQTYKLVNVIKRTQADKADMLYQCSDAGNRHFRGRKWIDPADPDGRTKLEFHHQNLSILFPAFASACPQERFIAAVAGVVDRWLHGSSAVIAGSLQEIVNYPELTSSQSA
jgi:hypothetical protein